MAAESRDGDGVPRRNEISITGWGLGGGAWPGDNFDGQNYVRGKLRHTSNFGAGPSDSGGENFVRGKILSHPQPSVPCGQSVVCDFGRSKLQHYQLNGDHKKKRARPRLALHTEGGRQPVTVTVNQLSNCTKKIRGGHFVTNLKGEVSPDEVVP